MRVSGHVSWGRSGLLQGARSRSDSDRCYSNTKSYRRFLTGITQLRSRSKSNIYEKKSTTATVFSFFQRILMVKVKCRFFFSIPSIYIKVI